MDLYHAMNKRLRTFGNAADSDKIDRISDIPDEVICHILSFLPTKDAIATSVLSTRYIDLFPQIQSPTLVLDDTRESSNITNLANFIDKLLSFNLPSIRSLSLTFHAFNDGRQIADWIGAFLPLKPERMDLRVFYFTQPQCLAEKLNGCGLKSLTLCLAFASYVPEYTFNMPNLTELSVISSRFMLVNALVKGSPLLEKLSIINCTCQIQESLRLCIKAPLLRDLHIVKSFHSFFGALELDAPNLENLAYEGFLDLKHLLKRLRSIDHAWLDVYPDILQVPSEAQDQAIEVLNACCAAQLLWLSGLLATAVVNYGPALPHFPNLVVVGIMKLDKLAWTMMKKLLNYAPRLCTFYVKEGIPTKFCGRICHLNSMLVHISQRRDGIIVLNIQRQVAAALPVASMVARE